MPVKRRVYDRATGEAVDMWMVDAAEAVSADPGRWSFSPPEKGAPAPGPEPAIGGGQTAAAEAVTSSPAPAADLPAPAPSPPKVEGDDLTRIVGIGHGLARRLIDRGIDSFVKLRDMGSGDIASLEAEMKFKGRIEREDWRGQAARLAAEAAGT